MGGTRSGAIAKHGLECSRGQPGAAGHRTPRESHSDALCRTCEAPTAFVTRRARLNGAEGGRKGRGTHWSASSVAQGGSRRVRTIAAVRCAAERPQEPSSSSVHPRPEAVGTGPAERRPGQPSRLQRLDSRHAWRHFLAWGAARAAARAAVAGAAAAPTLLPPPPHPLAAGWPARAPDTARGERNEEDACSSLVPRSHKSSYQVLPNIQR